MTNAIATDHSDRIQPVALYDRLTGSPLGGSGAAATDLMGLVGSPATVLELIPVLDTSAYADGDLLFDATELANFVRAAGKAALIVDLTVTDKDDQGVAFDLFTAYETVDFGTVNAAVSISDADAAKVRRLCRVETADYIDLGGVRSATVDNINRVVKPADASRSMFFAGVTRGAPTYTASGLVLRFGIIWLN